AAREKGKGAQAQQFDAVAPALPGQALLGPVEAVAHEPPGGAGKARQFLPDPLHLAPGLLVPWVPGAPLLETPAVGLGGAARLEANRPARGLRQRAVRAAVG